MIEYGGDDDYDNDDNDYDDDDTIPYLLVVMYAVADAAESVAPVRISRSNGV